LAYPGWVILPYENRNNLWDYTKIWISFYSDFTKDKTGVDILFTYELVWRLERCLQPIYNHVVTRCETLLEKYWPFSKKSSHDKDSISIDNSNYVNLPWDDILEAWTSIALSLLRNFRQLGYLDKWIKMKI
jgi:hypothetical protein